MGSHSLFQRIFLTRDRIWFLTLWADSLPTEVPGKSVQVNRSEKQGEPMVYSQSRGGVGGKPQSLKAQEPAAPMSKGRRWVTQLTVKETSPSSTLFALTGPSTGSHHPCGWASTSCLYSVYRIKPISSRTILPDTPRNSVGSSHLGTL